MGLHKNLYLGPYVECVPKRKGTDFAELLDEALFTIQSDGNSKTVYLAPNVSRGNDPRPDFDDDSEFHLKLSGHAPIIEMEWLKHSFAAEIEKLSKVCKSVEIKYGLHQFYM